MELAHRSAVVHGVESRDLIHTHGRHFQKSRYFIHDADAAESVLSLSEVEERHDRRLLVLGGVPGEDFLDKLLILRREFERYRGIVVGGVAVLRVTSATQFEGEGTTRGKG